MLKKIALFLVLTFSIGIMSAIEAPPPDCFPCNPISR